MAERPPHLGAPGGSAALEAQRLRERRHSRQASRSGLGRIAAALFEPESDRRLRQEERNWSTGAGGEQNLASYLAQRCPNVPMLHDRRAPGTRGNSGLEMARLTTARPLRLVRLHGLGLTRLGLLRADVIDCEEAHYDYMAAWAQALYGHRSRPHGMAWTSRQNDSSRAFILWGETRFRPAWLQLDGDPLALDRDPGLDLIRRVCADAGVDFEG